MQNFGGFNIPKTSILTELPRGNSELGEIFAQLLNDMVGQTGITNPKAEPFDVVEQSWKKLAAKPDKTQQDIEKLDNDFKEAIKDLAESYLLFIAKNVGNSTGKLDYQQYEKYMLKYRFGHYDVMNRPDYLQKVKVQIKNAFNKISAHGEETGDNIIDKNDMSAYLFAIATSSKSRKIGDKFTGFQITGSIVPEEYALNENLLFEAEDNLFSIKLRTAYKILNNQL